MSARTLNLDQALYTYLLDNSLREPEPLKRLREQTAGMPNGGMQISPEQGQFMRLLARLIGAACYLEVGTFTGYSAASVALALPSDGRAVCLDLNADYPAIGRPFWQELGVDERIELRIGPASDSLAMLLAEGGAGSFDFAFIDADKGGYADYYAKALELVRPGGLIAVDNVLWGGSVADPTRTDDDTQAIREFNRQALRDERVDLSLLPLGDGLTLLRRRQQQ